MFRITASCLPGYTHAPGQPITMRDLQMVVYESGEIRLCACRLAIKTRFQF